MGDRVVQRNVATPEFHAGTDARRIETFSPGCRPQPGSVVERLCLAAHQGRANDVEDGGREITLAYANGPRFTVTLADVAARIAPFPRVRTTTELPDLSDELTRRLYATYLACIDPADVAYPLDVRADDRGALASVFRSPRLGHLYVSRTKPGVVRGNHWHDRKIEKFLVVEGEAIVRLRPVGSPDVIERHVSGTEFRVVDVPPGYVHNIENVGASDMVMVFWLTEEFDPDDLDTHPAGIAP